MGILYINVFYFVCLYVASFTAVLRMVKGDMFF